MIMLITSASVEMIRRFQGFGNASGAPARGDSDPPESWSAPHQVAPSQWGGCSDPDTEAHSLTY
jgi:hypothetical protein